VTAFPKTIHFMGLNTPVGVEASVRNLEVEGQIPPEIRGAFFRAVPDPGVPPKFEDDIVLSGDGMIARFLFEDGAVDYDIRYVRTARYEAERKARKALFGRYRNPFTDDASVRGVDRTVANTTPIWHGGRLLMTKEDGLPYEIDPHTLETIGRWTYGGKLRSETMTAHARIDPATGEMFFFGYEAGGLCTTDIAYCIADRDGNLVSEQWFKQPYCSTIHDFAITEKHAIWPIFPTTADLDRLKAGGAHWAHQQDLESWVAIMPRYGKVEEMRWFKGPKGVSAFHIVNAFSDGELVHLDLCLSDTCAFAFMREAGGVQWEGPLGGGLIRWTFDLSKPGDSFEQRPLGPPGDMPRIPDRDQGRPYRTAWYGSVNPQGGPPLPGGPVGVAFNCLIRIEPGNGRMDVLGLPPGMGLNEPVHVPSVDPGHDGWLLAVVDRATGDVMQGEYESELWILDAGDISSGAVARIRVPLKLRAQVHGWWVPAAELAKAKAGSPATA
jgi:carotenoid cleavage dioxygenase